ncbi:Plastidal glycolate/glycerate translocator 1, chloroplastic [Porphyridium purpureum]|uniref:Plastidal glycolate/glycerate translocator 1, chloroplastic n=1 Tax=Porphyridium purpureum TaxID=35688 RepID=A0A5J4Z7P8_PORPP|nr:Plastidal glycolate/glycerate translocator 1, chloroplastic [Porphyridium purpureum]|eukprot:POR3662..scf295_1
MFGWVHSVPPRLQPHQTPSFGNVCAGRFARFDVPNGQTRARARARTAPELPPRWTRTTVRRKDAAVPRTEQFPFPVMNEALKQVPTAKAMAVLLCIDQIFKNAFARYNWCFPSALAAMCALLGALLMLDRVSPDSAENVVGFFQPVCAFFSRWLAVFFVPVLIALPVSARPWPAADELAKIAVVLVGGLAISLGFTAKLCALLRAASAGAEKDGQEQVSLAGAASVPLSTGAPSASATSFPCANLTRFWGGVALLSFCSGVMFPAVQPLRLVFTFATTLFGFCMGQRAAPSVKRLVHPLVATVLTSFLAFSLFGRLSGIGFFNVVGEYFSKGKCGACLGGGDLLMMILGPAIVSFAFHIFNRRALIKRHAPEVVGTTALSSFVSLFATAYVGRLLNLPANIRLSLIPRMVTAPLAICIGDLLHADPALAGALAATTGLLGANFYAMVLDGLQITDPIYRGISTGSASHGIGSAAILKEGEPFAFAAIAMVLCGVFSTVFISIKPLRAALIARRMTGHPLNSIPRLLPRSLPGTPASTRKQSLAIAPSPDVRCRTNNRGSGRVNEVGGAMRFRCRSLVVSPRCAYIPSNSNFSS